MPNATITVRYVNQPKPGARKGSVKTADNQFFGVWPDKLAGFQPNGVYDVEYTEDTGRDGQVWKTITSATAKGTAPAQSGYSGPRRSGNTYRETSARDAERMFVCSMLAAFIRAGKVDATNPSAMVPAVNDLRDVWDATFGADQQQQGNVTVTTGPQH